MSSWSSGNDVVIEGSHVVEDSNSRIVRDVKGGEVNHVPLVEENHLTAAVARGLLQLLESSDARLRRELTEETSTFARRSLKIGLMAFMGILGEDQCMERTVCEAGGIVSRYTPGYSVILTIVRYFVPEYIGRFLNIARNSVRRNYCNYYRCGSLLYEDSGNETLA